MNFSEAQKAIFVSFSMAGLNNIDMFECVTGTRYVTGEIGDKKYTFSHRDRDNACQYILSCNGSMLIGTFDPKELRIMIDKIIANPTIDIEKSEKSLL